MERGRLGYTVAVGRGMTTDASTPSLAPADLGAGSILADRYTLEARLGRGGGGTV